MSKKLRLGKFSPFKRKKSKSKKSKSSPVKEFSRSFSIKNLKRGLSQSELGKIFEKKKMEKDERRDISKVKKELFSKIQQLEECEINKQKEINRKAERLIKSLSSSRKKEVDLLQKDFNKLYIEKCETNKWKDSFFCELGQNNVLLWHIAKMRFVPVTETGKHFIYEIEKQLQNTREKQKKELDYYMNLELQHGDKDPEDIEESYKEQKDLIDITFDTISVLMKPLIEKVEKTGFLEWADLNELFVIFANPTVSKLTEELSKKFGISFTEHTNEDILNSDSEKSKVDFDLLEEVYCSGGDALDGSLFCSLREMDPSFALMLMKLRLTTPLEDKDNAFVSNLLDKAITYLTKNKEKIIDAAIEGVYQQPVVEDEPQKESKSWGQTISGLGSAMTNYIVETAANLGKRQYINRNTISRLIDDFIEYLKDLSEKVENGVLSLKDLAGLYSIATSFVGPVAMALRGLFQSSISKALQQRGMDIYQILDGAPQEVI